MANHKHKVSASTVRPFTGPVNLLRQNRAAHGNVENVERCRCGATRRTLVNGKHTETTGWIEPASPGGE